MTTITMNQLKDLFNEKGRISAFVNLMPMNKLVEVHMVNDELVKEYIDGEIVSFENMVNRYAEAFECNVTLTLEA
jgi:hypothetical protein